MWAFFWTFVVLVLLAAPVLWNGIDILRDDKAWREAERYPGMPD